MFIFNLGVNLNCEWEGESDYRIWYINIENKLSYPIKFEAVYVRNSNAPIRNIQPNELRVDWILNGYKGDGQKAHKRIKQILVYRESDNTLIMLLKGSEIDKYVIYTGKSIYGGSTSCQFLFEVKEEDFGVGVNKGMGFKEEVGDDDFIN
jgi:hypothetical protein